MGLRCFLFYSSFFFGLDAKVLKSISHEREVHLTYITSNFLLYRDNFWLQVTIIR